MPSNICNSENSFPEQWSGKVPLRISLKKSRLMAVYSPCHSKSNEFVTENWRNLAVVIFSVYIIHIDKFFSFPVSFLAIYKTGFIVCVFLLCILHEIEVRQPFSLSFSFLFNHFTQFLIYAKLAVFFILTCELVGLTMYLSVSTVSGT